MTWRERLRAWLRRELDPVGEHRLMRELVAQRVRNRPVDSPENSPEADKGEEPKSV